MAYKTVLFNDEPRQKVSNEMIDGVESIEGEIVASIERAGCTVGFVVEDA